MSSMTTDERGNSTDNRSSTAPPPAAGSAKGQCRTHNRIGAPSRCPNVARAKSRSTSGASGVHTAVERKRAVGGAGRSATGNPIIVFNHRALDLLRRRRDHPAHDPDHAPVLVVDAGLRVAGVDQHSAGRPAGGLGVPDGTASSTRASARAVRDDGRQPGSWKRRTRHRLSLGTRRTEG